MGKRLRHARLRVEDAFTPGPFSFLPGARAWSATSAPSPCAKSPAQASPCHDASSFLIRLGLVGSRVALLSPFVGHDPAASIDAGSARARVAVKTEQGPPPHYGKGRTAF
jgi:hypothetical protein